MEFGFALESSVAITENVCPPLHPASLAPSAEGNMLTLIVVPSIDPEVEDITELAKRSVKYLPDCEIVKSTSRIIAMDFAQGKVAGVGALTCIFQEPLIAAGATSLLPLLSMPASPSIGTITRSRYATAKFLFERITGYSLRVSVERTFERQ